MTPSIKSPRQLFGKATSVQASTEGPQHVDDAIAALDFIVSSRGDLQAERDRLEGQTQALVEENRQLTDANGELTQKLVEAHKIVTVLAQRISLSEQHMSQAADKLRLTEQDLEAQRAELGRVLAAIARSAGPLQQARAPIKLVETAN